MQGNTPHGRAKGADLALAERILAGMGNPALAVILWDGSRVGPSDTVADVAVADRRALWAIALNADLHFGDLYAAGRVRIDGDLQTFLETGYRAMDGQPTPWPLRFLHRWQNRPRRNSLNGSRENIHHHYDLGNDFYRLWLDQEVMQYTCAYYPSESASLEEAQIAKLHHVCRKLRLKPGDTVVEAGCGWGGLARFMAKHYGVKVRAFNVSQEQLRFAREEAERQGLSDRVEYVEDDYRNIEGTYDVFVSVGMLEHVGTEQYPELGAVIDRVLAPHGRGLIHTIGRNRPQLMNPWIEKRIFPGAYPPTLREMAAIFEPYAFSIQDVENIRLHYARTLQHWLERFEANVETVRQMFDEHFVRTWRLYLAGSIASFTTGELQLFQTVFTRPDYNELPWSRAYLYTAGEEGA
ncbi:cyclopropane-fatty-acyl-phospholipid synthase [Thiohalospira halophila DSM 15071]|uniref:Cyclopropane-fatty-acyl-phospholipid synthase n=1 Tax=Thiohalospira halophila DSM 15071 TaxID=1123397 RepID=A0A1I1Q760_9GAMM|nr:cyclopropane-fatty-acyl-phospholipid synthase family protein [Thiohalospira halophila]SFD13950.1 cyclopropane-fatty-acyl-phospholipid synthase [Thiohalospira halophila DSM 15071]